MAVTQSQYDFIRFAANADKCAFKGILAGFIITKVAAAGAASVHIKNYGSNYDIVPLTPMAANAGPIIPIMFGERGMPILDGIKTTICSGCIVIAVRR